MESANTKRIHRHNRIRPRLTGTKERPRLVVFRSLQHIYAQIVDDLSGHTLVSASDKEIEGKDVKPIESASKVGEIIGKKAREKKIKTVIFDRNGYKYHGRVQALAEGARQNGLDF